MTVAESRSSLQRSLMASTNFSRSIGRRYRQFRKLMRLLQSHSFRRGLRHGVAASVEHVSLMRDIRVATLIDVGANIGQFSLLTRAFHPDVQIIALEPQLRPAERYRRLFDGDPRTILHPYAIGPKSVVGTMFVGHRDDGSSLLPNSQASENVTTEQVEVRRLDEVLNITDIVRPAILKLDVQGYELSVLKSCGSLLDIMDFIYVEVSFRPFYVGQALAGEVVGFLSAQGFSLAGVHNPECDRAGRVEGADFLFVRTAK